MKWYYLWMLDRKLIKTFRYMTLIFIRSLSRSFWMSTFSILFIWKNSTSSFIWRKSSSKEGNLCIWWLATLPLKAHLHQPNNKCNHWYHQCAFALISMWKEDIAPEYSTEHGKVFDQTNNMLHYFYSHFSPKLWID